MVLRGLSRPGLPGHHLACPTSSGRGRVATLGPREFVWYPQQPTNGKHYINACEAGWRWEVQDLAERKQELWPRAEPQRGLRLGEELPCREQVEGGLPLTEKVVQDEPVKQVLLQAPDHNVLGQELGVDPLHQHLRAPEAADPGPLPT